MYPQYLNKLYKEKYINWLISLESSCQSKNQAITAAQKEAICPWMSNHPIKDLNN